MKIPIIVPIGAKYADCIIAGIIKKRKMKSINMITARSIINSNQPNAGMKLHVPFVQLKNRRLKKMETEHNKTLGITVLKTSDNCNLPSYIMEHCKYFNPEAQSTDQCRYYQEKNISNLGKCPFYDEKLLKRCGRCNIVIRSAIITKECDLYTLSITKFPCTDQNELGFSYISEKYLCPEYMKELEVFLQQKTEEKKKL